VHIQTKEKLVLLNIDNMITNIIQKIKRRLDILFLTANIDKQNEVVDNFHNLYYESGVLGKTWHEAKFLGYPIQKCAFDILQYQEIIYNLKPDLIIETGTAYGGSALYMATICDAMNHGKIITVDIQKIEEPPTHNRIKYLIGSSIAKEILTDIENYIKELNPKTIMVILDSKHTKDHVLEELKLYNKFVTSNSYLIVEDTNVNGHPVFTSHGPGPMEALEEFLTNNNDFSSDKNMEKHYLTFNPKGYLKKK
jgi:cephalosporin hydroxylase